MLLCHFQLLKSHPGGNGHQFFVTFAKVFATLIRERPYFQSVAESVVSGGNMLKCQQTFHSFPPRNNWWARPVASCTPLTEKTFNLRLLHCFFLPKPVPIGWIYALAASFSDCNLVARSNERGLRFMTATVFAVRGLYPWVSVHFGWCLSWRHG